MDVHPTVWTRERTDAVERVLVSVTDTLTRHDAFRNRIGESRTRLSTHDDKAIIEDLAHLGNAGFPGPGSPPTASPSAPKYQSWQTLKAAGQLCKVLHQFRPERRLARAPLITTMGIACTAPAPRSKPASPGHQCRRSQPPNPVHG